MVGEQLCQRNTSFLCFKKAEIRCLRYVGILRNIPSEWQENNFQKLRISYSVLCQCNLARIRTVLYHLSKENEPSMQIQRINIVKMTILPKAIYITNSVQFSSVTQSCLTLCDPVNHSMPGLPVILPLIVHTVIIFHFTSSSSLSEKCGSFRRREFWKKPKSLVSLVALSDIGTDI